MPAPRSKRHGEAIDAYEQELRHSMPNWPMLGLGSRQRAGHGSQRHDDALAAYDKALSIAPSLAQGLARPRQCAGRAQAPRRSLRPDFDKALALDPHLAEGMVWSRHRPGVQAAV